MNRILPFIISIIFFTSCSQSIDQQWLEANYIKHEAMVQMRDGVSLYTSVYTPVNVSDRPVLLIRTPYSCAPYGQGWKSDLLEYMTEFLDNEYIIVFQDVRGRYMSEGEYLNVRPYNPYKTGVQTDEASDTYDTIEWLLHNTDNNGSVGVTGMSYPGFYATMAALSGHPALKAVSPQAPILDWFKGDDVHHNGALMLLDIYSFAPYMFKDHNNPLQEDHGLPSPVDTSAYEWFLDLLTIRNLTSALPDTLIFWNEILQHPDYDQYWQERSLEQHLRDIKPAILVAGGEYDTDDCYGALNTYRLIRENSPGTDLHFVYGPWPHGGWHNIDYQGLGCIEFGDDLSGFFMREIEYPFFRYYLEGKGRKPAPVYLFASGSEDWQILDVWPSSDAKNRELYLTSDNSLSFNHPVEDFSSSSYISDPFRPVPFMEDASVRNNSYMVADQSFASERDDVLTFRGRVLDSLIKVQGPLEVELDLSLSTEDADIVIKLIDVHPDGYQMLVRWDVFPVRYRDGYDSPKPVVPGEMVHIRFTMNDIAHWFLPGHSIMVQIQSSCYPLVNMNPQSFLNNIYEAEKEDYIKSKVTVFHQKDAASRIILPVVR